MHSSCSIQQSAALALGRLANYSDDLAEAVVQNEILPQLVRSSACLGAQRTCRAMLMGQHSIWGMSASSSFSMPCVLTADGLHLVLAHMAKQHSDIDTCSKVVVAAQTSYGSPIVPLCWYGLYLALCPAGVLTGTAESLLQESSWILLASCCQVSATCGCSACATAC